MDVGNSGVDRYAGLRYPVCWCAVNGTAVIEYSKIMERFSGQILALPNWRGIQATILSLLYK